MICQLSSLCAFEQDEGMEWMSLSGSVSETKDLIMAKGNLGGVAGRRQIRRFFLVAVVSFPPGPFATRLDIAISRILALSRQLLPSTHSSSPGETRNTCKDGGEGSASQHEWVSSLLSFDVTLRSL